MGREVIVDYSVPKGKCPPVVIFAFVFEDVIKVADTLKEDRDVIINITYLTTSAKLRFLDFICGLAYGLGLKKEKIENGVYQFTH